MGEQPTKPRAMAAFAAIVVFTVLSFSILGAALLSGCVTDVPIENYTLARAAVDAAKDAEANRFAPSYWYTAEQSYREGQKAYRDRRYSEADRLFEQAKVAAEKAENFSRVARQQSGDMVP